MSIWLKRGLIACALAALVAAAIYVLQPEPIPVDVSTIGRGELQVTVAEDGVTRIRDVFVVSAPITGKLERLTLEVGDLVEAGERIALVRPVDPPIRDVRTMRELEAALKAAEAGVMLGRAEVERAEAALRYAELELRRQRELAQRGVASERVLQQAQLEADTRRAQVSQAKANLELRRRELESAQARVLEPAAGAALPAGDACCVEIIAPSSGAVLKLHTESEQVVQAGAELLEIGDRASLELIVDLLSSDAVRVKAGDTAWITNWGGSERLEARVRRIDPAGFTKVSALGIEEQRVNATIDIVAARSDWVRLGHDFRIFVEIVVWKSENALRVPLAALFRQGDSWAVFIAEGETAALREVTLGRRNDAHAEVLDGLQQGDTVILHPSDRIANGVDIVRRSEETL